MARHVHLVRHGEVHNPDHVVYAALPGFALSGLGRAQAKEAARYLGARPIVAVWSSPLQRALETAEGVASRCGLPISVDPDLVEWALLGRWAGVAWDDVPSTHPGELEAYLDDPSRLPFADETLRSLAARVSGAIRRIDAAHRDGDVVVVGHQDPVQAARLALTGRDVAALHTDKPGHASVVTLTPGNPWREEDMWTPEVDC